MVLNLPVAIKLMLLTFKSHRYWVNYFHLEHSRRPNEYNTRSQIWAWFDFCSKAFRRKHFFFLSDSSESDSFEIYNVCLEISWKLSIVNRFVLLIWIITISIYFALTLHESEDHTLKNTMLKHTYTIPYDGYIVEEHVNELWTTTQTMDQIQTLNYH